jgi:hypothetical protein
MEKLCKYCHYSKLPEYICTNPIFLIKKVDLVSGEVSTEYKETYHKSCKSQRDDDFFAMIVNGTCGKKGRYYKHDLNKFKDEIKNA